MSFSLLLDAADPEIWAKWMHLGIFHGITTNPTLLKQAGQPCNLKNIKHLSQIAQSIGCKEFHIQAWGNSSNEITNCGLEIGELSTPKMKVNIKIPITKVGCEAASKLIAAKIPITFTACFEAKQVLIASAIGAQYIAPYMGRINDLGRNGIEELIKMQDMLNGIRSKCKILVASIRNTKEIIHLASNGLQTFTINNKIAEDLFQSNETLNAFEIFEADVLESQT